MNAVRGLPTEILFEIVNYNRLFEIPTYAGEIFHKQDLHGVVILHLNSMLSIQSMSDVIVGIKLV